MLNDTQIEQYREKGYVGVEGVLSADEVASLRRVTDEFVERSRGISESDDVFDLEPGHSADEPRLRRLKSPINAHEVYDQTIRHDKILDIVAQLVGPATVSYTHLTLPTSG